MDVDYAFCDDVFEAEIKRQVDLVVNIKTSQKRIKLDKEDVHFSQHSSLLTQLLTSIQNLQNNEIAYLYYSTNMVKPEYLERLSLKLKV